MIVIYQHIVMKHLVKWYDLAHFSFLLIWSYKNYKEDMQLFILKKLLSSTRN